MLNWSKIVVNEVNVVNVAEHAIGYATPNPAGQLPKRLWVFILG
jgi:hypothetical protein